MTDLAIFGGQPIRNEAIPWVNTMGTEETQAVLGVMESGTLSAFYGRAGANFLGGPKVLEIEQAFTARFGSKHAISVNSATTALHTAIAACEIGPGDEVLVTPYTMVATASAILMNNAIPVFVDIEEDTFNLDPACIERWISPRTKAIVVANIFGLPARLKEITKIARQHGFFVIEDNAQAPGATIDGQEAGTFGDLSIFSLNYHKVIHSGEGGMILTSNDNLAHRCQLIRNHGEVVLDDLNDHETVVLGTNYRMTELHAAIGIEQLNKLDGFLKLRRALAAQLTDGLTSYDGLTGAAVPEGYEHSYYVYPIRFHREVWGIERATFAAAMKAEGFPLGNGYVKPIYRLPIFQHKKVYNQTTFPFSLIDNPIQEYKDGICSVTERMYDEELLIADVCRVPFTEKDITDFLTAISKIWGGREQLLAYEKNNMSRA
ncbi:DegT/DnrJ/EryC1/StrS family aminotransferase [Paenibacillus alginolyticus]|uniref:DegT/DnrJ/EryC1/StrS family aminotransferase n=1 Tax=Paenibacillus alginolyticus TaxID=59839 RepID=A0ABT4G864_9BACL|nr:DegT/DnrJ/EryC1/StrS family aminotransferase [Paenibacillus alginolyticus]MCY9692366.1 DegT/DnrJ/EryC1/StrS family aminotransferase [Paenibacillus alginolyticus]MEC0143661.1 DegT/DnrJ/EryC1/StrS family aminotransferase [Paenibacillus alginolyticus]